MALRVAAILPLLLIASCSSSSDSSGSSASLASSSAAGKSTNVTYVALDSTPDWNIGPKATNLKLSAANGWKVEPRPGAAGALGFTVSKQSDPPESQNSWDIE